MNRSILLVAVCPLLGLVGCATQAPVAVKDVVANPESHLVQFAPTKIATEVLTALPRVPDPTNKFTRFEFESRWQETSTNEKNPRNLDVRTLVLNSGNGLFSSYEQVANNEVPFRINYKLTYQGITPLKWQTVFLNYQRGEMAFLVKRFQRRDPLPAAFPQGARFESSANTGSEIQASNLPEERQVCTLGNLSAARELHPALSGQALDISCEDYGRNGQLTGKVTFAYLESYGFALRKSYSDSRTQYAVTISNVRIQ